jgi:DNA modification methylase
MSLYYEDDTVTLYHGDCRDVLRTLPDCSVDAVCTDPPYGLGFMGNEWDRPGSAARGYKTDSDLALNPYSRARAEYGGASYGHEVAGLPFQQWCEQWARECLRVLKPGGHLLAFGGSRTSHRLACGIEDAGFEKRDSIAWLYGSGFPKSRNLDGEWEGWGTALKPAHEPIIVGRKPLVGTVAANVARYGTGALNIDGCRTSTTDADKAAINAKHAGMDVAAYERAPGASLNLSVNPLPLKAAEAHAAGRWPTNVLLDGDAADELDRQSGSTISRVGKPRGAASGDGWGMTATGAEYAGAGGASRFFPTFRYEAKAPADERPRVDGVAHPTVKPLDLMRWLVRLVTPPGGTVLEPFAGSGTTAEACVIEGFRCIAIEREPSYLPLIEARLSKAIQPDLFGGAA